jgi:hypothetical protein
MSSPGGWLGFACEPRPDAARNLSPVRCRLDRGLQAIPSDPVRLTGLSSVDLP